MVEVGGFWREKAGWMDRGKERESKGQQGKIFFSLHPPLLPAFLFSSLHVKDKPGGTAVWPSDCVWRLAVPLAGTPLITGASLSLLDTKTPHADCTACTLSMQTHKHNEYLLVHVRERW